LNTLELELSDGVTLAVPASLQAITTYVLLEQETWFEKEMTFLRRYLKPGMTVIDIGANLGVYSLPMARLVGAAGQVFAYEPASETRALLERSRSLNVASHLEILPFALSDVDRDGKLVFGASSELNALGDTGEGETVRVTSLDREEARLGWRSPDFIKIDAEGEEERILAGGHDFFRKNSPLVMFEVKVGNTVNETLRGLFPTLGYRLFRQLGGAPVLVPDDERQPLDAYELNMFAAKPDRIASLAQQELLIEKEPTLHLEDRERRALLPSWRGLPFTQGYGDARDQIVPADAEYGDGLAAYAVWSDAKKSLSERYGALNFAVLKLRSAVARAQTVERLSTFVRATWDAGLRTESVQAVQRLMTVISDRGGQLALSEPLWPASARFDRLSPGKQLGIWFIAAAAEQWERSQFWSTWFGGATSTLDWLSAQTFSSTEMERRRILVAAKAGKRPAVPPRLCAEAPDHLNAHVWRNGLVPGTAVGP
jgi:FkbM family methyltransferase